MNFFSGNHGKIEIPHILSNEYIEYGLKDLFQIEKGHTEDNDDYFHYETIKKGFSGENGSYQVYENKDHPLYINVSRNSENEMTTLHLLSAIDDIEYTEEMIGKILTTFGGSLVFYDQSQGVTPTIIASHAESPPIEDNDEKEQVIKETMKSLRADMTKTLELSGLSKEKYELIFEQIKIQMENEFFPQTGYGMK